jgi:hypothetical protein
VGLWLVWIPASGGYYPAAWYPSAAGAVSLAIATHIGFRRALPSTRAARVALLAFAALVALNYLSILWAGSRGDALSSANELLLLLAVAWTMSLLPWTPSMLAVILGVWSLGVAVICGIDLARAAAAENLGPFFYSTRYATPLQYPNATAALAAMSVWPALLLSARREVPAWARIPLLGVAVFLADFAFLPQSRGALVGIALTTVVVVLISGRRVALAIRMLIIGGALAVTIPRTVAVYQALTAGRRVRPVLQHTAAGILLTTIAAVALSLVLVVIEQKLIPTRIRDWRPARPGRRGLVTSALVAVVVVAAGAVAAAPAISRLANSVWHSGHTDASTGSVRLLSATPEERFDYIHAAVKLWDGSPVLGVGSGNFGRRYDAVRTFPKHSQYTHFLALRVLSETGAVGALLFIVVIAALLVGLFKAMRELPGVGRACAVAAAAMACYFAVHSSLEWLDEFPVLAAPPLALALAAIGMRRTGSANSSTQDADALAGTKSRGRRPPAAVGGLLVLALACAAAVVLGAPYLQLRYTDRALASAVNDPSAAYKDLSRAADINPLSADALITEGTIAIDLHDPTHARQAFAKAITREDAWYPHLELALLFAQAGQFPSALKQVDAAAVLDHDDALVDEARTRIQHHQRIDPIKFNSGFIQGAQSDIFLQRAIR